MWKDVKFLSYDKFIHLNPSWFGIGETLTWNPKITPFENEHHLPNLRFFGSVLVFGGCTPTYSPTCRAVYRSLLNSHCPSGWIFSAILISPVVCASERLRSTVSLYWEQYASDRFQISMLPAWRCLDDSTISVSVCQKMSMKNTKLRRHCFFQRNHWLIYARWWFQRLFIFTPTLGKWSKFDYNFSIGLKPPPSISHDIPCFTSFFGKFASSSRTSPKPPSRNGCFSRIAGPWNHGLPCRWYNPSLSGRRLEICLRQDLSDQGNPPWEFPTK